MTSAPKLIYNEDYLRFISRMLSTEDTTTPTSHFDIFYYLFEELEERPSFSLFHGFRDIGWGNPTKPIYLEINESTGGTGDDTLDGGAWVDVLYGGDHNDGLLGGASNDSLFGGTGNDQLLGGDGNDQLTGDAGNDTLTGGTGNDQLTGGDGADRFVFGSTANGGATGTDTVSDFVRVQGDKLGFEATAFAAGTTLAQILANHTTVNTTTNVTTITFDGGSVRIDGVTDLVVGDLMLL
jgi:Ca2+-binding RTX toxin-like protein